jgi:molybdopterin molybdotransferase
MTEFFRVTDLPAVLTLVDRFPKMAVETVPLLNALNRVLAEDLQADINLPAFARSTMDGYAVRAGSTFGASESNPAYIRVQGSVNMGQEPNFSVAAGAAARIATGGMLPEGADSVVMIEHTAPLDDETIEIYKSVAPGQHVILKGEDFAKSETVLTAGLRIRPQEAGLLAALGQTRVTVHRQPAVGIISTGDEIVPIDVAPQLGEIRDINTYTLASLVTAAGGHPLVYGLVRDDYGALLESCKQALTDADMILISGGSSVGTRDFTVDVLSALPDSEILVHGVSISPGKPTILARAGQKSIWGLPGHVVSAMVVFETVVRPFMDHVAGLKGTFEKRFRIPARLNRNLSSAQGRTDFVRVRLESTNGELWAHPVLGKSGLISTMVQADGLIEIGLNVEGLDKGSTVRVMPFET